MKRPSRRRLIQIGIGLLVLVLLIYGFWPEPVPVQTATVTSGPLQVIVEEEGQTRAQERYVVSSPVAAYIRRIDLEPGDAVLEGETIAELESPRAPILDPRTLSEARARVDAARAALERARTAADQAVRERDRLQRLAAEEAATGQQASQAAAEAEQALAAREAARSEVEAAEAALSRGNAAQPVRSVLRAPVSGRVLTVHRESAGHVNPGEPILELGDTGRLEVEVDVLSQDAVRIGPGTRVLLAQWGGEPELEASVTRVAPQGFSEISALGVEERRVTIVAGITTPPEQWAGLGAGYRVLARFVVWEAPDVLQAPTSALFRTDDGGWAVFVVEDGRAHLRTVTLGHQSGLAAEITSGLAEGEVVVVHAGNEVGDGVKVE